MRCHWRCMCKKVCFFFLYIHFRSGIWQILKYKEYTVGKFTVVNLPSGAACVCCCQIFCKSVCLEYQHRLYASDCSALRSRVMKRKIGSWVTGEFRGFSPSMPTWGNDPTERFLIVTSLSAQTWQTHEPSQPCLPCGYYARTKLQLRAAAPRLPLPSWKENVVK